MRGIGWSIVLVASAVPAAALAQGFEGVQQFQVTSQDGKAMTMTQISRGGRVRMEMPAMAAMGGGGEGAYMLVDWKTHDMNMVMPGRKMYMAGNLDSMAVRMPSRDGQDGKITNTGKKETVAGISCEVWRFEGTANGKPTTIDMCLAKGAGLVAPAGGAFGGGRPGSMNPAITKMMKEGYGVLKASRVVDGKPQPIVELLKQEKRTVAASEVEVPAGFMRMDMGMMGGPGAGKPAKRP